MTQTRYFGLIGGILLFATAALAQTTYQMDLTGLGDGATANGVYVSPYQGTITSGGTISGGTITGGAQIYSGYMICDDFNTDSSLNSPWTATASVASSGTGKFSGESYTVAGLGTFNSQQMYDAVAYLANQLVLASNVKNNTTQTNLSFAIWDIMDLATSGKTASTSATDPDGGAFALITQAFQQVESGYVGTNVEVFTATPASASQEFLVVNGPPISTPEPTSAASLGFDLMTVVGLALVLRRRFARSA